MYVGLGKRRLPSKGRASRATNTQRSGDQRAYQHDDDAPWEERTPWYELRPFRGMLADVRRRLPYYASDWLDGLKPNNVPIVVASIVQIFFINLMPAIAYVLDMHDRTDGSYGVNEVILASAMAAIVFSLFSAQPLTFVGVTGLTNLMNYTVYDIAHQHYGLDRQAYLRLQCWMLIWAAGFHFLAAIFNLCDYTRFITDMTSETFGLYVGVIYVQKGIELLTREFGPEPLSPGTGWLAVTIAVLFSVTVYFATMVGASTYLPFHLRRLIAQLAFVAGCIFWTGFSHFPGRTLSDVPVSRLPITRSFFPTLDRPWLVDFWRSEVQWVFVGAPLGLLLTLLFYFDHNVSSVMAQARKFPITKPAGFHWDFFLLGITTFVAGILGLPVPNGLVPQAPYNTDSLTVYTQDPVVDEEQRGARRVSATGNASLLYVTHFANVRIVRVVQQRLSHFIIGLLTIGAMTRPILVALGTMPRAVFAGVFLVVGWASIESNPIVLRSLSLLQDRSAIPIAPSARTPIMQLSRLKIASFVGIQWLFFGLTIAISQTIAAIGFPVLIILMIPCRVFIVPQLFSESELSVLDAPTATSPAVLRSLGVSVPSAEQKRETSSETYPGEVRSTSSATSLYSNLSDKSTTLASKPEPAVDEPPTSHAARTHEDMHQAARPQPVRFGSSNMSSRTTGSRLVETFDAPSRPSSAQSYASVTYKTPREFSEKLHPDTQEPIQDPRLSKTHAPRTNTPMQPHTRPADSSSSLQPGSESVRPTGTSTTAAASQPNVAYSKPPTKKASQKRVRSPRSGKLHTVLRTDRDDSSDDEPGTEYIRVENPPRGPGKGMPGIQIRRK